MAEYNEANQLPFSKKGHKESECWKKRADSERTGSGNGSGHTDKGNGSDRTTPKDPENPEKGLSS